LFIILTLIEDIDMARQSFHGVVVTAGTSSHILSCKSSIDLQDWWQRR